MPNYRVEMEVTTIVTVYVEASSIVEATNAAEGMDWRGDDAQAIRVDLMLPLPSEGEAA